jgi:hypothetical protein
MQSVSGPCFPCEGELPVDPCGSELLFYFEIGKLNHLNLALHTMQDYLAASLRKNIHPSQTGFQISFFLLRQIGFTNHFKPLWLIVGITNTILSFVKAFYVSFLLM